MEAEPTEFCILGQAEKDATRILNDILKKYDKNLVPKMKVGEQAMKREWIIRPPFQGVDVDVELLIQKVSEISELTGASTMHLLFSQIWHDPGLSFEVRKKWKEKTKDRISCSQDCCS